MTQLCYADAADLTWYSAGKKAFIKKAMKGATLEVAREAQGQGNGKGKGTSAPVTLPRASHATEKVQKHAVQNVDHDDEVNEVFAPACLFSCVVLFHIS